MKRAGIAFAFGLILIGSAAAATNYGPYLLQPGDKVSYLCNGVPAHWMNNPQAGYVLCGPYPTQQPVVEPKPTTVPSPSPKPL